MLNTLYISLSRQIALRQEMSVIANNMANMTTTGFKGSRPMFEEYMQGKGEPVSVDPVSGGKAAYVNIKGTLRDVSQGPLETTGNSTDLALQGEGFFVVETADGPRYTRNGHLSVDTQGNLTTTGGLRILGEGDRPINLPRTGGLLTVSAEGSISVDGTPVGRLRLVEFDNRQSLQAEGNNLFSSPSGNDPVPARATKVVQSALEASNVQSIAEMTRMIEVSRSYQSIQSIITAQYDLERSAIQTLGKVA